MGLFSRFTSSKNQTEPLRVDLGTFEFGNTQIGARPSDADGFGQALLKTGTYQEERRGIELSAKDGLLDSAFLTLEDFDGEFLLHGSAIELDTSTSEQEVQRLFGDPYWTDRSDGEVIQFYEYAEGALELQFEFPDATSLGFITVAVEGILSNKKQRDRYGVTKPWPPELSKP